MTDEELKQIGLWARDEARHTKDDPILKELYKLVHKQTLNARKPGAPPALRKFIVQSLAAIAEMRRASMKVVK